MNRDFPDGEAVFWPDQCSLPARFVEPGQKGSVSGLGGLLSLARASVVPRDAAGTEIPRAIRESLAKKKVLERLDDRLCPGDSSLSRAWCQGGFEMTARILGEVGMNEREIQRVLKALAASGSGCDCGVLYNSAQQSRLKTEYWLARALGDAPCDPHSQMREG